MIPTRNIRQAGYDVFILFLQNQGEENDRDSSSGLITAVLRFITSKLLWDYLK